MLSLQYNGTEVVKMPNTQKHLQFFTPAKSGERSWQIVDEESGNVVDSYTPPRKTKTAPGTHYKDSWADTVNQKQ